MKVKSVRLSHTLGVILVFVAVIVFLLLSTSSASGQYTAQVIPKVNVESGGTLNVVGANVVDFGTMGPGQNLDKTLTLEVTANSAWRLTVGKNQDLTCSYLGASIPSADLTYTSNGTASGTYVSSSTEFGSTSTPSNVITNGAATGGSNVNVVYRLVVPGDQPSNNPSQGYYSAVHTYTLVVGSP